MLASAQMGWGMRAVGWFLAPSLWGFYHSLLSGTCGSLGINAAKLQLVTTTDGDSALERGPCNEAPRTAEVESLSMGSPKHHHCPQVQSLAPVMAYP